MSCNSIVDVSRVFFCGPVTAGRNWIGVGSSFDISCVETLKMTVPDTSAVEIVVGAFPSEMIIDASHVALRAGSESNPAINFGLIVMTARYWTILCETNRNAMDMYFICITGEMVTWGRKLLDPGYTAIGGSRLQVIYMLVHTSRIAGFQFGQRLSVFYKYSGNIYQMLLHWGLGPEFKAWEDGALIVA